MDVNIEIDASELLGEIDLNDYINIDLDDLNLDTHIENLLNGYLGDRDNLCSLGKQFKRAIQLTVREMMADPEC